MKVLKPNIKLFDHQEKVLKLMDKHNSYGIYLDMGLGKTLIGLSDMVRKAYFNDIKKILVLAPIAIKAAWKRDLNLLTDEARQLIEPKLTITNYEQLQAKAGKKLMSEVWDYIIIDEGHKIKDKTTNTHKLVIKLALNAKFKYILTGTPVVNGNLINYWSYDTFMHPVISRGRVQSEFFGSISNFKRNYCILDNWYNPKAYVNVNQILDRVKDTSIRLYKKDCLDLPEKLEPVIFDIPLTPIQKNMYKEMAKTSTLIDYELLAENGVSRLNYLRQISSGFVYVEDQTIEIPNNNIKILKDFLTDHTEPLVIFYNFTEEYNQIKALLDKMKISYYSLNGKTKEKDRDAWVRFQNDDTQIFLAQIESGARGIDLYKASTILYYSLPLSSETFEQSKDRIHRAGMRNVPASYIIFQREKTVDEEIYKALKNYMDFNEIMFDTYIDRYVRGQKIDKKS